MTTITKIPARSPLPMKTILLYLCDKPIPQVSEQYGDYHQIFSSMLERSYNTATGQNFSITVKSYYVVEGIYPTKEELEAADAIMLSGSSYSAYAPIPWIDTLVSHIGAVPNNYPALQMIGICFGHQIISRSFGGECIKNPKGWELGVRSIQLTKAGNHIFGGLAEDGKLRIHQVHQDHVPSLPPGFELIGSTDDSPVHGMVRYFPGSSSTTPSLREVQILTLQGHPEFSPDIVLRILDAREAKGIISSDLAARSRVFAKERDQGQAIGAVILQVLGVA